MTSAVEPKSLSRYFIVDLSENEIKEIDFSMGFNKINMIGIFFTHFSKWFEILVIPKINKAITKASSEYVWEVYWSVEIR